MLTVNLQAKYIKWILHVQAKVNRILYHLKQEYDITTLRTAAGFSIACNAFSLAFSTTVIDFKIPFWKVHSWRKTLNLAFLFKQCHTAKGTTCLVTVTSCKEKQVLMYGSPLWFNCLSCSTFQKDKKHCLMFECKGLDSVPSTTIFP